MSKKPVSLSAPPQPRSTTPALPSGSPTIALALGGGGARGLAHIPILEAFDELGLQPKIMAGTSIGAVFAAAYASGLDGPADPRAHARGACATGSTSCATSTPRGCARRDASGTCFRRARLSSAPERLLDIILPPRIARDFAHLAIPLKIVASDFYAQEAVILDQGPLRQAIAASMALPVIFEPVVLEGRVLIDGGLVNPLPFDLLCGEADLTVAVDVSGAPMRRPDRERPKAWEALFAVKLHLRAHDHQREAALAPTRRLHRRRHEPLSRSSTS